MLTAWVIAYNNDDNLLNWGRTFCETCYLGFRVLNQGSFGLCKKTKNLLKGFGCEYIENRLEHKSLARTWNKCVLESPTKWVMISNDDVEFCAGWCEVFQEYSRNFFWVGPSYCFCISKELHGEVGAFDDNFEYLGFEDDDYLIRMQEMGFPIVYGKETTFGKLVNHKKNEKRIKYDAVNPNYVYFYKKWAGKVPRCRSRDLLL